MQLGRWEGGGEVKNAAAAVAYQKINYCKGQSVMQKKEEQDGVASGMEENSQQARVEWIRGIFTGKSFLFDGKTLENVVLWLPMCI